MKKITILFAMALLLGFPLAAMSTTIFTGSAEPTGDITSNDGYDSSILKNFRTSTNVQLVALGTETTYVAVSGHTSGSREFGSSSGDSKLYWMPKEVGIALTTSNAPTPSDSSAFVDDNGAPTNGWSAL